MEIPQDKAERIRSILQSGAVKVDFGVEKVKGFTGKIQEVPYVEYVITMRCYSDADERKCAEKCGGSAECITSCLNEACDREEKEVRKKFEEAAMGNISAVLGNVKGAEMVVKDVKLISMSRENFNTTVVARVYFIPSMMGAFFAAGLYYQLMCMAKKGDVKHCLEVHTSIIQGCFEKQSVEEIKRCITDSIR